MSADYLRPDEYLLRRVHRNQIRTGSDEFTRGAITPNSGDTDGLSFYREASVSLSQLLAATDRPDDFLVLRIKVAEITKLGLSVVQKPDESPEPLPGHCIIPELNHGDYQADKATGQPRRWPKVQDNLLKASSRADD